MATIERLVHWPDALMPLDGGFVPAFATRGGGRTQTMAEQVIKTGLGFWRADFRGWKMMTAGRIRAWRALEVQIGGRAGVISLPIFDFWNAPFPVVNGALKMIIAGKRFSDGTPYDDGAPHGGTIIGATLAADVARNATALRIAFEAGSVNEDALIGSHFSLASTAIGPRAHRIADASEVSSGVWDVTVWPWTRAAYEAGEPLEFDAPRCAMRLEKDDGLAIYPAGGRWGEASVTFTEFDPS